MGDIHITVLTDKQQEPVIPIYLYLFFLCFVIAFPSLIIVISCNPSYQALTYRSVLYVSF